MKILLFGGSGQVGTEVVKRGYALNFEVVSPVISELDITEQDQVLYLTRQIKPAVIVNCAAYTAVDKAEVDRDNAFKVNEGGARISAIAAKDVGARLIHISTDYIFPGDGKVQLTEDDPTGPLNVYGESKLAGEKAIQSVLGDQAVILRTSSVHGQRGVNFVHTMIDLFKSRELVQVVFDQVMSPTWAGWLAEVILDVSRLSSHGILNACCDGETSWFDFAVEIHRLVAPNLPQAAKVRIEPIPAADYPRPAKRPRYSSLDTTKLTKLLGRKPIAWQEGVRAHLAEIGFPS